MDISFVNFLNRTREEREIPREALRGGLCSENEYGKIEIGQRYPDKPIRDRLLGRLGERGYEFENFLQPEEYADWQKRDTILEHLEAEEDKKAEALLKEYEAGLSEDDKVSRQFCLAMRLQLIDLGFGEPEKKAEYLKKALHLTVLWKDSIELKDMVLSIEELNLILEYISFCKPEKEEARYQELLDYMNQERFDEECRAMLIPKVALYYCTYLWEKLTGCEEKAERKYLAEQATAISEEGIEHLRNNERAYFAWELLQKEAAFLNVLLLDCELTGEEHKKYAERRKWNADIFTVLDSLYEEMDVPKKTCVYTCFYREYEIYCINDVLRARRKMLGLKKGDFETLDMQTGRTICIYRTVCRIESGKSGVQRHIARHMMRKMNLPVSFQHARIATESKLVLRMEKKYRNAMNQGNYEAAESLFKQIKSRLSMEQLINRQYVAQNESDLDYYLKRITKEEYAEGLQRALEVTVPLEVALQPIRDKRLKNGFIQKGEKYLTNTEIRILKTLSRLYGDKEDNPYPPILLEYYEWFEKQRNVSNMINIREFAMAYLDSFYGNIGDYDKSDRIGAKLLCDELYLRRLRRTAHFIYSHLWNDEQRKKKNLPIQKEIDRQACFKCCITLTDFCKDDFLKQWFENKLS